MMTFWAILKREFLAFFYAPIAYVVGTAFLAMQGFSFWALMRSLSDPKAPATAGAVFRSFFGGTLLHWFTVFAVVAVLSMRSVAEDRRTGMWEATLTTRASAAQVLWGKWLALLGFYVLLWLPSILLIWIFQSYLPQGQSIDLGPVCAAYLGVFSIGAALLAMGVAVSSATDSQVVSAVVTFALFLAWLMYGEYHQLAGGSAPAHGLFLVNLRQSLSLMAQGEVHPVFFVSLLSLVVMALTAALVLTARDRRTGLRYLSALLLVGISGTSLSHLVGKHHRAWDWSAARVNSLEPTSLRLLAQLTEPVSVVVVRPHEQVFEPVHQEVMRLLDRMQGEQNLLSIQELDPLTEPEKLQRWAFDLAIRPEDLSSGGAVVFKQGQRQRVVDLLAMASFAKDDLGVGALSEFRAESAFGEALRAVVELRQERLCVSAGHGELPIDVDGTSPNWQQVSIRLQQDGVTLVELGSLDAASLRACDGLVIMGASRPFAATELQALATYLKEGGNLLVALRWQSPVLRMVLEEQGMHVLDAVVVDPSAELALSPAWMTYTGYTDHAIVAGFHQRRATVWNTPYALVGDAGVDLLVAGSAEAWAEDGLAELRASGHYERGPTDSDATAVALAKEGESGMRLVLLGSAESMSSVWSERGIGGNDRFLLSACLWILDRQVELSQQDKRPEYLRLVMSKKQLASAFVWCVVLVPLFYSLLGAALWWWRRRED